METLLYIGLSNAAAATLLALAAALVGRFVRRPALTHALWVVVLVKLVTPPLVHVPVAWPALLAPAAAAELLAQTEPAPQPQTVPPTPPRQGLPPQPEPSGEDVDLPGDITEPQPRPQVQPVPETLPEVSPHHEDGPPALPQPVQNNLVAPQNEKPAENFTALAQGPASTDSATPAEPLLPSWEWLAGSLWLAGAVLWWLLVVVRMLRFRQMLRFAEPLPEAELSRLRHWAERLGVRRCPAAYFVDAAVPPLLWALGWHARLLLPRRLWQQLSTEQQDTLLLHELAHLRRRDHWVRRLELLALGLYWWHPVAWLARHQIQEVEEQCCDGWVVWAAPAAASAYAGALVETIAFLSLARAAVPPGASGSRRTRHIQRRLTMICQGTCRRRWSISAILAVLLVAGLFLPLWPTLAAPQTDTLPGMATPTEPPRQAVPATTAKERAFDATRRTQTDTSAISKQTAPEISSKARNDGQIQGVEVPAGSAATQNPGVASTQSVGELPGPKSRGGPPPSLVRKWKAAQDQLELAKYDEYARTAELEAAKALYELAVQTLKRLEALGNAVSPEDLAKARTDAIIKEAAVRIKKADQVAALVRLRQAHEAADEIGKLLPKGASPQPPATKTLPHSAPAGDQRINELEKKLDRIEKQLDLLQKILQPKRPGTGGFGKRLAPQFHNTRNPINVPIVPALSGGKGAEAPGGVEVREYVFAVSIDRGNSWNIIAKAQGDTKEFTFRPPDDGDYLFQIEGYDNLGKRVYNNTGPRHVVDTVPPEIKLTAERDGKDIIVRWAVVERNLDTNGMRLQYKTTRDKTWHTVLISVAEQGSAVLHPEGTDPVTVRMQAQDRAGNQGAAEISVAEKQAARN
jgi:beta-lactamase regulating signal transducer with metallopeptidase domain